MEILTGRNSVREALVAHRRHFHRVTLADSVAGKKDNAQIVRLCRELNIPVALLEPRAFERVVISKKRGPWGEGDDPRHGGARHQGIAAQVSSYPYVDLPDILDCARQRKEPPFLLGLDSLQDPQNVGALLRTAEVVGVHGVILPARRSAHITPAVSRASAGAVEHLSVALVTNLGKALDSLKDKGIWAVGGEKHPRSQDYRLVDLDMPLVLVLGSEGRGLRRLIAQKCDILVHIPMKGHVNSLNVSVAGSILLYHAQNVRNPASYADCAHL